VSENFLDGTGDKPYSWWMFDDAASPSLDGSANGNNLNWFDGSPAQVTTPGLFVEGAASLTLPTTADAVSRAFASIAASTPLKAATTALSISGWVLMAGNATSQNGFSFSDFAAQGVRIGTIATGKVRAILYGNVTADLSSNTTLALAGWHHVVLRWNGDNRAGAGANDEVSLWVDGVKQTATATLTSVTLVTASPLKFAGAAAGFTHYDEWALWNVALTDTQILDLYRGGLAALRQWQTKLPTAAINNSGGNQNWVNPGNVTAEDGVEATITDAAFDNGQVSHYLNATAYGFTVPSGAAISGIEMEVARRAFAGAARDWEVRILYDGGASDDKADATAWPATIATRTLGGPADIWGRLWTDTEVNHPNFGALLMAMATAADTDIGVDFVRLTVYYTGGTAPAEPSALYPRRFAGRLVR
jgi:hypothetical protein